MAEKFCAGIDITSGGATALIVSARSGRIAAVATSTSARSAFEAAKARSMVEGDQLIGVGICGEASDERFEIPTIVARSRAHACVPGSGVASPSTMVLVFEADRCRLLMNSRIEAAVAGVQVAPDSILSGYFGYELPPIDLNDEEFERFAFAVRHACETLRGAGVAVRRFVATRDRPGLQVLADVLDARIKLAASDHPVSLGAAILAAIAAGPEATGHANLSQVVHAMAHQRRDLIYRPDIRKRKHYDQLYADRG